MDINPARVDGWRRSRWRVALWMTPVLILLLPAVAMQFTDEVKWGPGDFLVIGFLLFGVCGAFDLVARRTRNMAYRIAVAVALVTAFLSIWVNLAVGILGHGSAYEPANLLYGMVLVVGVTGAFIVRFRPDGMVRVMLATAIAQAIVALIALILGPVKAFVLTSVFVALWLVSAGLFRTAARRPMSSPSG